MKIRDVITFDRDHLSALNPRNQNQRKRIATNSQALTRNPQFQNAAPLQDFPAHADPIDGVQSRLLPAQNPSLTALSSVSTAHRRDLDFIKAQLARLLPQSDE
jgi:hypothetical protein